jgi:DNA-binding IclR family transcriptional regulator
VVEQDDVTGRVRLGLIVLRLAEAAERTLDLRSIAMPELDKLARATRETTGVGVAHGDRLLTVAQADGPHVVAMGDWTGRSVPMHSIASGKVLLSAMPEREILRLVKAGLDRYTDRTITELEPLLEELARVRRRGYATAFGEFEPNLNAVAAPVYDARGQVAAAVDVWGPSFRITPNRMPELIQQVRASAAAVSVRIGGTAA